MSFQRSYSKVWWGSDNQLPAMSANSNRFNGSSFYSFYSQQQHQPPLAQQQQLNFKIGHTAAISHHHLAPPLEGNSFKSFPGNLSRIQEVEDEQNISKMSWEKRDSPGSLRSQDSGFSDNEESHSTRGAMGGSVTDADAAAASSSPSIKSKSSKQSFDSPTSLQDERAETPPTVIRRCVGKSQFYSSLVNVSRRISFSGSPASCGQAISGKRQPQQQQPNLSKEFEHDQEEKEEEEEEEVEGSRLMKELDSMHLVEDEVKAKQPPKGDVEKEYSHKNANKAPRRRRLSRRPTMALSLMRKRDSNTTDDSSEEAEAEEEEDVEKERMQRSRSLDDLETEFNSKKTVSCDGTHHATAYSAEAPPPYNNETVLLGGTAMTEDATSNKDFGSPLKQQHSLCSTSTPKMHRKLRHKDAPHEASLPPVSPLLYPESSSFPLACREYPNPLLNGHEPALQSWIGDLRTSYEHEVMSTLQTKSIAAQAFKNLTITTNTVAKIIRQLQQRAQHLQLAFECLQRTLRGEQAASLAEAFDGAAQLVAQVEEFSEVLQRRALFFTESPGDRRRYEQNLEQMKLIAKDTRISLQKQHYIRLESLLEDLLVLRRCLLLALRLVFEKLVRVIVQSIEHSRCDLMLRANINMIATLTNIDYDGFASLSAAFVQNGAVRALLVVCLDHRVSSVRALALRALATICCAPAAIVQLGACGGVEILRDILQAAAVTDPAEDGPEAAGRVTDMERREAVSLLTQITAAWHGPEHRVDGLRDAAETIIEGLTALMTRTRCAQTLLLCAAAMNNLSRIEVTSHYSIMSNEAIFKWIETMQQPPNQERQQQAFEGVTVFLYEQIAAMLYNMSLNKKCHSHLANGSIVNFVTSVYQAEFYRVYESRAQRDAQRRTIKAILHMLTRLVQESTLGPELLELQAMPVFLRTTLASVNATGGGAESGRLLHDRTDTSLTRQLAVLQQGEQSAGVDQMTSAPIAEHGDAHRLQLLLRQESYV